MAEGPNEIWSLGKWYTIDALTEARIIIGGDGEWWWWELEVSQRGDGGDGWCLPFPTISSREEAERLGWEAMHRLFVSYECSVWGK